MHCCCSFAEGLYSVTSDPLLLTAVPKICCERDEGGASEGVSLSYDYINVIVVCQRCLEGFNDNGDCAFTPHEADGGRG